jgi:hypothetical protein
MERIQRRLVFIWMIIAFPVAAQPDREILDWRLRQGWGRTVLQSEHFMPPFAAL